MTVKRLADEAWDHHPLGVGLTGPHGVEEPDDDRWQGWTGRTRQIRTYGVDVGPSSRTSPSARTSPTQPVIVEAITRLNIGGPARHVLDITAGLADRYSMRIATGTAPQVEGELDPSGLAVDRLPMVRSVAPRRDAAALVGMRRLLRHHDVDLVHSHMAKAGSVARMAASSMHPRPRTVHTFHGHVLAGYFSPRSETLFARIERQLARRTDRLVAVSADIRDALLDLGIGRPSQYDVLPLGVDLDPYLTVEARCGNLRRALGIASDVALVGAVARLAPVKDHATLLKTMVQLPGVHLAVLGDGELRDALEAQVSSLGLGCRVHFTGWWHDMPSALADIDVAVLTSRNEGTPMALIEAAAAGTPAVATDVGGVGDVVLDGRTGLVVGPGDATGVAAALQALLGNPRRRERMGLAGREHVKNHFGLRASLQRVAELYDSLLSGTR